MSSNGITIPNDAILTQAARLKLPGMLPQETRIFEAWWRANGSQYDSATFNVRVGAGVDPGPGFDNAARRGAILNSQYRIDALVRKGSRAEIVEVKYRAHPVAIGQLLTYKVLWMAANTAEQEPLLRMVVNQLSADMMAVAASYGITVDVQDADFTGLRIVRESPE
jgi:hypothetical protein